LITTKEQDGENLIHSVSCEVQGRGPTRVVIFKDSNANKSSF